MPETAVKITVKGRVQGVGFRPFVYQLALKKQIVGTVQNNMDGVYIHAQGLHANVQEFIQDLTILAPRLSKIRQVHTTSAPVGPYIDFTIIASNREGASQLVIPIDAAVCDECIKEMRDSSNPRYRYPFINCTQCGPRYTIIDALPYDRPFTSMESFAMCSMCNEEYEDEKNRRHHAQPIACPECGPTVSLVKNDGENIECSDPIQETIRLLKQGEIVAVKGIGGFHLCCDASNEDAVERLRQRKNRPKRPLAVMAVGINNVEKIAYLNDEEKNLLKSPESPIVVLKRRYPNLIAPNVAPQMETIGVMLPYTPLHHLLLEDPGLTTVVLTSANLSGQPLLYQNTEAIEHLKGIADFILLHNRKILHPIDDSVIQIHEGEEDFLRRARGYVPDPIDSSKDISNIVAFGSQQKATFTIGRNGQVFVGPHIGDLENIETIKHYKERLNHLLKWLHITNEIAVIDAHPGFNTRHVLKDYLFNKVIEVQHHHAHMAACMEENELNEPVWGIILDGTGYGEDGNIWGFEVFYGDYSSYQRMAHLRYTPLPGGEKAIKEPWRNGAAMLIDLLGEEGLRFSKRLFPNKEKELSMISAMLSNQLNIAQAGTCGRLFDAVSAICGLCHTSTYDGEAAISLAELADLNLEITPYSYEIKNEQLLTVDFTKMLAEIVADKFAQVDMKIISSRFHETITQALCEVVEMLMTLYPSHSNKIVFSGGSFHNRFIRKRLKELLMEKGFVVFNHKKIPCNDGGLSYGQLFIAAAKRGRNESCV